MTKEEARFIYSWHFSKKRNPLRLRYTMERADRARAAVKLKEYLLTQRLLRDFAK